MRYRNEPFFEPVREHRRGPAGQSLIALVVGARRLSGAGDGVLGTRWLAVPGGGVPWVNCCLWDGWRSGEGENGRSRRAQSGHRCAVRIRFTASRSNASGSKSAASHSRKSSWSSCLGSEIAFSRSS